MKSKTSELKGVALDWAVAMAQDLNPFIDDHRTVEGALSVLVGKRKVYEPSSNWAQSGPIIERYSIQVERGCDAYVAYTNKYWWEDADGGLEFRDETTAEGGDYLTASMRCFVEAKLGDEVEIPDELRAV